MYPYFDYRIFKNPKDGHANKIVEITQSPFLNMKIEFSRHEFTHTAFEILHEKIDANEFVIPEELARKKY